MEKKVAVTIWAMALAFFVQAQDSAKTESDFHDMFISGFYNHLHDGFQYGMGIAGAYYKNVYAETRYNYEDIKTFSVLAGYSFGNEDKAFQWELVPMAGFCVGNTNAFLPALETNFIYKKLTLYSENEYAIDMNSKADNFFYSWSELTYKITDWLQPGTVAQRTRLYQTGREIDRGFMVVSEFLPKASFTAYLFDPFDKSSIFFVLSLTYNF